MGPPYSSGLITNLDPPFGARSFDDLPRTSTRIEVADSVEKVRGIDVTVQAAIEPRPGEPFALVGQKVERLSRHDMNAAVRATEIPRLAKLHATGLDRNDHARHRSNFLTSSKIEANGSVHSSIGANGDGIICDPCAVDAAFARTCPHILKRNRWRYISRTL